MPTTVESGTHSILDVDTMIGPDEIERCLGGSRPTRADFDRGPAGRGPEPSEIALWGISGD